MLLMGAYELKAGMILAEDILNGYGTIILAAGVTLTDEHIASLQGMDVDMIFVENEPQAAITAQPQSPAAFREAGQKDKFEEAVQYYKSMFMDVQRGQPLCRDEVFVIVKDLVKAFYSYDDIFSVLGKMKSDADYEFRHSTSVAIISILLGKWLKLDHQDIYNLALAAYVADIGKAALPVDMLKKSGPLSESEQELMQSHVALTQDILEASGGFSHSLINIAISHHERLDGTGYPYQMEKDGICQLSRIVAVADTYHALLSDRPFRKAYSIVEATEMLWNMSYSALDPMVSERLVKFITAFWVGGRVVLSNGLVGEVVMSNQYDRFRPLVRVDSEFIDLSKDRSCRIVRIENAAV